MYSDISRVVITDRDKFVKLADDTPTDTSKQYAGFDLDKFQLHVLLKSEKQSNRNKIPANLYEQISYLLAHVMVTMKTQSFHTHQNNYKYFFWSYIIHAFFKGFPTSYIHIFLGQYAPDHHLFIGKMSPLLSSTKYFIVFAAIFELYSLVNYCARLLDYVFTGLIYKNPWDRCDNDDYEKHFSCTCLPIVEFQKRIDKNQNTTVNFAHGFIDPEGAFQLSQIAYFIMRKYYFSAITSGIWIFVVYCLVIWVASLALTNKMFKKKIWKFLLVIQIIVYVFYLIIFFHLSYKQESWRTQSVVTKDDNSVISQLMLVEYSLLTQSLSALPVMQMLSARSTQELRPGSTSSLFVICLSFFYLFRGLLLQEMKLFASDFTKTPLIARFVNEHWFYIWPLYFLSFKLGNLWTLLFYIINFVLEFIAMTISFNMITEVIYYEWKMRRLITGGVIIFGGIMTMILMNETYIGFFNFYSCVLPSVIEVIIIYLMYPYGRLIEDITFKYSEGPSLVQMFSLLMLPFYVFFKTAIGIFYFTYEGTDDKIIIVTYIFFGLLLLFLVIQMIITIVRHTYVEKKNFCRLFVPAPDWGPTVRKTRDLRKIFRSNEYIGSQAPRPLVRHMIKKAGSDYYKIDVNYDALSLNRSSFAMNFEEELEKYDNEYDKDDHEKSTDVVDAPDNSDKPGPSTAISEVKYETKLDRQNNLQLEVKSEKEIEKIKESYERFTPGKDNLEKSVQELIQLKESIMNFKSIDDDYNQKQGDDDSKKIREEKDKDKEKKE